MKAEPKPQIPILSRLLALAGGSVAGQLAMIAVLPVITRLYEPADFGLLGAFSAIVMIVLPAACLRFDLAVPIAADDDDARALIALGFIAATVISLSAWAGLHLFTGRMGGESQKVLGQFGWLIPISIWMAALFSLAQYWAIRQHWFRALALSHAARGGLGAATQVICGLQGIGAIGLMLGQAIYMGLGALGLMFSFIRHELNGIRRLKPAFINRTARQYWRFPVYSTPESLLDAAGTYLPMLLIINYSGAETGGLLYLAQRITSIPVGLIGGNLSRVFVGEAPQRLQNGSLFDFTFKMWRTLIFIGLPAAVLGFFLVEHLTTSIFGPEWSAASGILAVLIPPTLLQFCVVPISTALHVMSKQAISLILQLLGLILQVGSIMAGYLSGLASPITAFALGATVYYLVYTVTVLYVTKTRG